MSDESKKRENNSNRSQTKRRFVDASQPAATASSDTSTSDPVEPVKPTQGSASKSRQQEASSGEPEKSSRNENDQSEPDSDQDSSLDYEPVLARILDEKKLALLRSPELVNTFNDLQQTLRRRIE